MDKEIAELAFIGNWSTLLPLLRRSPHLVNAASEPKGYTPLHQAAWHGADLAVVGELLALGADRSVKTHNKHQTAQDIALEKHPHRADLEYVLVPGKRTLAQLMRKVAAETPLFEPYDGNQVLFDRLIECFGTDSCHHTDEAIEVRLEAAVNALAGETLSATRVIQCGPGESFAMAAETRFWKDRFLPMLRESARRANAIPLEKEWAVVADLFDPAPDQWGLRGDRFLWMEMRHALCHVEIPEEPEVLAQTITCAFAALTGVALDRQAEFYVKRFARGGMSSGMVSGQFWSERFIPLVQRRAQWLQETWR
jgi:hypothetical protein